MAAKKVGTLIKEARTNAGFTQEQLAKKIAGLSANDLAKAEKGEKELTQDQLKAIAKATGVTQKSLLDAAKGTAAASSASGTGVKLSAAEKEIINLYRKADDKTKKAVKELLEEGAEETGSILSSLLGGGSGSGGGSLLSSLFGGGSSSNSSSSSGIGSSLITTLLGAGGGNNNNNSSSGSLLGSILGGVLGGKREMPEGGQPEGGLREVTEEDLKKGK